MRNYDREATSRECFSSVCHSTVLVSHQRHYHIHTILSLQHQTSPLPRNRICRYSSQSKGGSYKSQHDTGKNLKTLVVFTKPTITEEKGNQESQVVGGGEVISKLI